MELGLKAFVTLGLLASCTSKNLQHSGLPYAAKLIYEDSFERTDTSDWVVESEMPFAVGKHIVNGALHLDASAGITIWNRNLFAGDVLFEFEATVVSAGGLQDRVSDLNCFWMATDPSYPGQFFERSSWRKGVFWNYYTLNLYYVGFGGHNNTKSRMRKYDVAEKIPPPVLMEYSDPEHLIMANKSNLVRIVCSGSDITYSINGEEIFRLKDEHPYREGHFGFRTVRSHMKIEGFKVYSIRKRAP